MIVRRQNGAILRQLRTLYNLGTIGDLTDGQLLERFATDPDEVAELAFSALVERHQALVWRVCLAIVGNEHEAEDAFQATFLVLVRKARSLWVQDSLGPWLHQVACRTASSLRTTDIRRRRHERRRAERDATHCYEVARPRDFDLDAAIHEAVNGLPQKYRAPVVLCDLEGRTHQEAARFLGWPIGTVKSRQSQGRGLIRDRLVRRGFGLAVAAVIVESLRQSSVAAMPKEIARTTVIAAMQQTARLLSVVGISAQVLTLTQGALRAMFWIRFRSVAVAVVAVGIMSGTASVYVNGSQDSAPGAGQQALSRPTTTTGQPAPPKVSEKATGPLPPEVPTAKLRAQQLATRKAKASREIARLTRELAEIAIEEYEEVGYPQDLASVDGEIKLAESDQIRSEDRLEWARKMFEKKYVSESTKLSEELMLKKAQFGLQHANAKRKALVDYTKRKTMMKLRSDVEKARSDEFAKAAAWDLEEAKEIELERQLRGTTN